MSNDQLRRVLLVDDHQALLDALKRQHRKHFTLVAACGPEAALRALNDDGPFAVVVSDYQMPGMNGAVLLEKVSELRPDITRIMLTGQADLSTATEAVNRGNIFRFLTKPCDPDLFRSIVEAGIEQHRLLNAERRLLETTVKGAIEVLTDVLALSNPAAFGRSNRVQHYVSHVVAKLKLSDAWQYETAALLSQIGAVAIPAALFDQLGRGESLAPEQLAMMEQHPQLAHDLLGKIPRLKNVAAMVFHQRADPLPPSDADPCVQIGCRILAAALEYEELLSLGANTVQALKVLRTKTAKYDRRVIDALATAGIHDREMDLMLVSLTQLSHGMILHEEIRNKDEMLVVPSGHKLTPSSLAKLRNYGKLGLLKKRDFTIRTPREDGSKFSAA